MNTLLTILQTLNRNFPPPPFCGNGVILLADGSLQLNIWYNSTANFFTLESIVELEDSEKLVKDLLKLLEEERWVGTEL